MADKIVFCDTGFMIRLLNESDELHKNALGYYQYFLENHYLLKMSTIAVAEFCVKDKIANLPLKQIMLSPFNPYHASKAGICANILFNEQSTEVKLVDNRIIIQNDVKLFAQAQIENAEYYLTSDSKSKRMYDVLKDKDEVSFKFTDIHTSFNEIFGVLKL